MHVNKQKINKYVYYVCKIFIAIKPTNYKKVFYKF